MSSSSASIIGGNLDILTLILTRLPLKSLLVNKSVSKQWCSIITDPRFSIPGLFWGVDSFPWAKPTYDYISLDGNSNSYVPLDTLTSTLDKFGLKIVQSCNGLLLCTSCSWNACDFTYSIFNPFTKQYKILPKSHLKSSHKFVHCVSLAFDPFKSPYYKVIAIWKDGSKSCYNYRIEIYDSETSSWRLSGFYSCTPEPESIPWSSCIFWNGSLYWCHPKGGMVYFDIYRELIGPIRPAPGFNNTTKTFEIVEYNGHFYLFEKDHAYGRCSFSIFEMDADYPSWIVKGQVDLSLNPFGSSSFGSILFIIDRGEEKESSKVVLLTFEGVVVYYDLKDMSFEKIYDLSVRQEFSYFGAKFYQYIESLACV